MPPKVNPTHFHPTTPQAPSKSMPSRAFPARASRAHNPNIPPAPEGETLQEKVKRLRAAAARAKEAQISPLDKFLVRGRVWADRAHRIVAWSLIGFTGVAGVVVAYALGDMMLYNRKKKKEWVIEQKQMHLSRVAEARAAIASNTATPEQIEFMEIEERLDEFEEQRRNQPSTFARGKDWFFSGLGKEDAAAKQPEDSSAIMKAIKERQEEIKDSMKEKKDDVKESLEGKKNGVAQSAQAVWEKERKLQENGGPLDRAGLDEEPEKPKSGGWTSWMSFR